MAIHATCIGRLGADAEVQQSTTTTMLKLRLATSHRTKEGETTTWIGATVFGRRAESLAKLGLSKGDRIAVRGELFSREHNGKTYIDINCDDVELLGGKKGDGASAGTSNGAGRGAVKQDDFDGDEIGF